MTIPAKDTKIASKEPLWTKIAAQKVAARDALIPKEWLIPPTDALNVMEIPTTSGILSTSEIKITETEAPLLVSRMVKGELSSYDVVLAFCKRAAIAQQLVRYQFRCPGALPETDTSRQTVLRRSCSSKP